MERLMIKIGTRYLFVKVNEIDWIEADRNYLRIHKGENSYLVRQTLKGIEKKLNSDKFIRINRSTIINVERIKELRTERYSKYIVVMDDDNTWCWGRRFRNNLLRFIAVN
jgi:two-component system LytT family response regulator